MSVSSIYYGNGTTASTSSSSVPVSTSSSPAASRAGPLIGTVLRSSLKSSSPSSSNLSSFSSNPSAPISLSQARPTGAFSSTLLDGEEECLECGQREIIRDKREGVLVCGNCGIVKGGNIISEESEWRNFADDGPTSHGVIASRVGGPEGKAEEQK